MVGSCQNTCFKVSNSFDYHKCKVLLGLTKYYQAFIHGYAKLVGVDQERFKFSMDTTTPNGIWYIEIEVKKLLKAQILTTLDFMKIFISNVESLTKRIKTFFSHKNDK